MTTQRNRQENYEKPSKDKQWHERSEAPVATSYMTKAQILEFKQRLVDSYQCESTDIDYDFEKITDENDEDRDDCFWLKYKMKCILAGKPILRVIFSIKIPVPDKIKEEAKQHLRTEAMKSKTRLTLPAPTSQQNSEIATCTTDISNQPNLKKPTRKN